MSKPVFEEKVRRATDGTSIDESSPSGLRRERYRPKLSDSMADTREPIDPRTAASSADPSPGRSLGEIAQRAAARARRGAVPAPGSITGTPSASNDVQRPHVTVRPQSSPRSSTVAESASPGNRGARNAEVSSEPLHAPSPHREDRDLVGESLVRAAARGSELVIPPGSRITPAARDLAFERDVRFVTGRFAEVGGPLGGAAAGGTRRRSARIAVASDHGGFALKDELLPMIRELGHRPEDHGPGGAKPSVDYPDFAQLVAREVSQGRADFGLIVDGAGIGSAMVANKFPGVRAANCWNVASAQNAREHNHANVLTLGSGHLDLAGARAILTAFLATDVGADRHARRAHKLDAIEREQLRARELAAEFDEGR